MKTLTFVSAIALTLMSTAALAERGSAELNDIAHASSSTHQESERVNLTPADLTRVNGGAAKNGVAEPRSEAHDVHGSDDQIAQSSLPRRNAS